jgi:hypothetical protein
MLSVTFLLLNLLLLEMLLKLMLLVVEHRESGGRDGRGGMQLLLRANSQILRGRLMQTSWNPTLSSIICIYEGVVDG